MSASLPVPPAALPAVPSLFRRIVRALFAGLAALLPVTMALWLFAHLCERGLAPELLERDQLEGLREELLADRAELLERQAALLNLREAMEDPIYAERIRRVQRAKAPHELPGNLPASAFEPVTGKQLAEGQANPEESPSDRTGGNPPPPSGSRPNPARGASRVR